MKSLYCLLVLLVLSVISQAKQFYLRRSEVQELLDIAMTYPELFILNDVYGDDQYLSITSLPRELQIKKKI